MPPMAMFGRSWLHVQSPTPPAFSQGLPVWSRHVGDRILESNITRRVDCALFIHTVNDYHPGHGDPRTSPIRRP